MRVLILANGDSPTRETAQMLAARHDLIIAVDGAIHVAASLGLTPHILMGDFDSVRLEAVSAEFPDLRIIPTPDQDQSDLEKAVAVASDLGAASITVIGAAGGRMDHTLANTALLLRPGVPICLADDFGTVQTVASDGTTDARVLLETSAGDTVSLITFERDTRVSITGVQWPLNDFHLLPGTRGVSNVALGSSAEITVQRGSVFVCHLYEKAVRRHSELRTPETGRGEDGER
jgi:thiamine pyrophosphokinase